MNTEPVSLRDHFLPGSQTGPRGDGLPQTPCATEQSEPALSRTSQASLMNFCGHNWETLKRKFGKVAVDNNKASHSRILGWDAQQHLSPLLIIKSSLVRLIHHGFTDPFHICSHGSNKLNFPVTSTPCPHLCLLNYIAQMLLGEIRSQKPHKKYGEIRGSPHSQRSGAEAALDEECFTGHIGSCRTFVSMCDPMGPQELEPFQSQ